tara:strand:+ start:204 stop:497 length:294 start_codon:yes stop_codon:yes gene_type:complete
MRRYYCPYCNPKYQFPKEDKYSNLLCGICGEDLIQKPFIDFKKIVSLLLTLTFTSPLIYLTIFVFMKKFERNQIDYQSKSLFIFRPQEIDKFPKIKT